MVLFFNKPANKQDTQPSLSINGNGSFNVVAENAATRKIWYYQLNLERNLGKDNPLNEEDLREFLELEKTKADSDNSWSVSIDEVDRSLYDLSVKNPHKVDEIVLREPAEIIAQMRELDFESNEILAGIQELIGNRG